MSGLAKAFLSGKCCHNGRVVGSRQNNLVSSVPILPFGSVTMYDLVLHWSPLVYGFRPLAETGVNVCNNMIIAYILCHPSLEVSNFEFTFGTGASATTIDLLQARTFMNNKIQCIAFAT